MDKNKYKLASNLLKSSMLFCNSFRCPTCNKKWREKDLKKLYKKAYSLIPLLIDAINEHDEENNNTKGGK